MLLSCDLEREGLKPKSNEAAGNSQNSCRFVPPSQFLKEKSPILIFSDFFDSGQEVQWKSQYFGAESENTEGFLA